VRECLEAVRTTGSLAFEILVVHHLESGNGDDMRRCVERFGGTWIPYRGAFDFARMNNLAASRATAPYLLFMNDDVLVREAAWDRAIAATLARPEIGIAGAVLEYPNGSIQHAGVVVGMGDGAGHCGRFQRTSELWPWLRMSRDVSAVTGAMLGIRTELFRQMSGFDEAFPVNYNDVDLCLRVRKAGLRVVCLNLGEVIHRESQTRIGGTRYQERDALYKRWASVLARPDEFYSPHLAPTERIALNLPGVTGFSLSGLSIAIR
jgi:GT2 family glycosyltransferase